MHSTRYLRPLLIALAVIGAGGPRTALGAPLRDQGDSLYVGDMGNSSVQRFDAQTGAYLGAFVAPGSGGLHGPQGILFTRHGGGDSATAAGNPAWGAARTDLLVANQNVGTPNNGEIDRYAGGTGTFMGALVPNTDPNGPYAPFGLILSRDNRTLYVADPDNATGDAAGGSVERFDVNSGRFLGNLDFSSFINNKAMNPTGEFHPRSLVFGPNGLLYVTLFSEINPPTLPGWILSYNLYTGAIGVVAYNNPLAPASDCTKDLHRPDGLTFGPDPLQRRDTAFGQAGDLYVTSFRANASDTDKILIFNAATGACISSIALYQAGQPRSYAQALLFGPDEALFVPISGGADSGAVRKYDVRAKTFVNFVQPSPNGVPLMSGWYLTFGQTNPNTLAYDQ